MAKGGNITGSKEGTTSKVSDPAVVYQPLKIKPASKAKVISLKDGLLQKPSAQVTNVEKMKLSEEGISKKDLEALKEKAGLDYDSLAQVLSVARATLINKKGTDKFNEALSEKIVALADIYSFGYEVFEDEPTFNAWVFHSNKALGGKSPFQLLHNTYGREEVRNLIGRISYGVYS